MPFVHHNSHSTYADIISKSLRCVAMFVANSANPTMPQCITILNLLVTQIELKTLTWYWKAKFTT